MDVLLHQYLEESHDAWKEVTERNRLNLSFVYALNVILSKFLELRFIILRYLLSVTIRSMISKEEDYSLQNENDMQANPS